MPTNNSWKPVIWHCISCGAIVRGNRNSKGLVEVECGTCGSVMISKPIGRRHNRIEVYAPLAQDRVSGED